MGYIGFRLGLWPELIKVSGLVAGIVAGFRYYQAAGDWIAAHSFFGIEWASVLALAVLVGGVYFLVVRLLRLGERLAQMTFHKKLTSAGGLVMGIGRALLVASVVWVACLQLPAPLLQESIEQHSLSGKRVSRMAPAVYDTLSELARRLLG